MLCSISQSGSLLSSPRSSSDSLVVPLHSVTPLFVKLQWYAFKRCETSCTKNCLYAAVFPVRFSHSSCDVLSLLWKLQKLLLLLLFCSYFYNFFWLHVPQFLFLATGVVGPPGVPAVWPAVRVIRQHPACVTTQSRVITGKSVKEPWWPWGSVSCRKSVRVKFNFICSLCDFFCLSFPPLFLRRDVCF